MALESLGTVTAKRIDLAFQLCHDLVKDSVDRGLEGKALEDYLSNGLRMNEKGLWAVYPSMLDGLGAVEIRIVVG